MLILWHHRDRRQDQGAILPPFETQRLTSVLLAERDLAALANHLDLDILNGRFGPLFHAIMLSCGGADGKLAHRRSSDALREDSFIDPT